MCLSIASINSGSNGNCYYVGNQNEAILVDAGISCREIEKRMKELGLSLARVKAIFVSHEHSDHIRGLSILSKKYQLPVYITEKTLLNGRIALERQLVRGFSEDAGIVIGDMTVHAFRKHHDAADPFSFVVCCRQTTVGVFTDIGTPCKELVKQFRRCNAAFLEANYDEIMLDTGSYPYHLKRRIRGGNGHLSNTQALDVFVKHRPSFMTHLVLSHLSKNNNCPKLVEETFSRHANGVKVVVASRYQASDLYHIAEAASNINVVKAKPSQLAFAFT